MFRLTAEDVLAQITESVSSGTEKDEENHIPDPAVFESSSGEERDDQENLDGEAGNDGWFGKDKTTFWKKTAPSARRRSTANMLSFSVHRSVNIFNFSKLHMEDALFVVE